MKKLFIIGAFAVGAGTALFGDTGVAVAAPSGASDVVGQTYADASAALSNAGMTASVGVVVGGTLPKDECIVTNMQVVSALRPAAIDESYLQMYPANHEVLLTLNCAGAYATATSSGASVASPQGREAKAAAEQAQSPLPTEAGIPCTGANTGECIGLSESSSGG